MEILIEAFPFVFGVLLGLTCTRLAGTSRNVLWAIGSVALGAFATLASGEYKVSPLYFLFDMALVGAAAAGVAMALTWLKRRHS